MEMGKKKTGLQFRRTALRTLNRHEVILVAGASDDGSGAEDGAPESDTSYLPQPGEPTDLCGPATQFPVTFYCPPAPAPAPAPTPTPTPAPTPAPSGPKGG